MHNCEFDEMGRPMPREGMSSVKAVQFLQENFPEVKQWTNWFVRFTPAGRVLRRLAVGIKTCDRIGSWTWNQLDCPYPVMPCWQGETEAGTDHPQTSTWTGAVEVTGDCGARFILFSWLGADGIVGFRYLVSTTDLKLLERFVHDLNQVFHKDPSRIRVRVFGGKAVDIPIEDEVMVLPETLQSDIECQVRSFFRGAGIYAEHKIPHRRGFLFIGPPGNGKTLMIRQLIRFCHREFKATPWMLRPAKSIDEDMVEMLFTEASTSSPAILIFEDMDTLTRETRLTRAGLLAQLDGLGSRDGILVIGSTNNPGDIDPALIHRPSRFDRVWHFKLPDTDLRTFYLTTALPILEPDHIRNIAARTRGWSFAYLNELRTTAIMMSINDNGGTIEPEIVDKALGLLDAQFHAGEKNHTPSAYTDESAGFAAA